MEHYGSLRHAKEVALRFAGRAKDVLETRLCSIPESEAKAFLWAVVDYVVSREL
jgi:geranylgeranyl pyrophosphate synthase